LASTAVILAGFPGIAGLERGLYRVLNRPVIEYVIDAVPDEVDELVISVPDEGGRRAYMETAEKYAANIHVGGGGVGGVLKSYIPLSSSDRFLVLPCDAPMVTQDFTTFMIEACGRFSAALLRDAEGATDYHFSSFKREPFLEAAGVAGSSDIGEIAKHIRNALYIHVGALKVFDEKLNILFRVTSIAEARRAERVLAGRLKRR